MFPSYYSSSSWLCAASSGLFWREKIAGVFFGLSIPCAVLFVLFFGVTMHSSWSVMLTRNDTDRMILGVMPVLMGANEEKVEVPSLAEQLGHLQGGGGTHRGVGDFQLGSRSPSLFASWETHNRSVLMNNTQVSLAVKSFPSSGGNICHQVALIQYGATYDPAFCCFHSLPQCWRCSCPQVSGHQWHMRSTCLCSQWQHKKSLMGKCCMP